MAAPINIAMALDTSEVAAGARKATDAIENVSDSLDHVARDGEKSGERLEDALREAQKETADTEQSFKDLGRGARRNLDDVGDSARHNFGRAADAAGTFKEETISNLSEVASSFDGSMSGIADGVQGTFGGLALALSNISLPAALAAGAIGLIGGAILQSFNDTSEAVQQRTSDMYDDMIQSGLDYLSQQYLIAETQKLLSSDEGNRYDEIKKAAEDLGLSVETVAAAYAGWGPAIEEVSGKADELADAQLAALAAGEDYSSSAIATYRNVQASLDSVSSSTDNAATRAQQARSTVEQYGTAWSEAEQKAKDAAAAVEAVPDKKATVTVDISGAKRALEDFSNTQYGVNVIAQIRDRYGRSIV